MATERSTGFGDLLRRHRLVAGLSQQALAELAGLSVDAIAALERGRRRHPRAFTVRVLADTLGLDAAARNALVRAATGVANGTGRPAGSLPGPATALVGRDHERDALAGLLRQDDVRLVTLTGPGGIGKTQLALTVARRVADDFPGGVGWAPLSLLGNADALLQTVAAAFRVRETPGLPLLESVIDGLSGRDALLLLDNCEHLVSPVATLVEQLLSGTTGLRILTTSRERLRLSMEVVRPVAPLAVPSGAELDCSPAADLFLRRARQLVPDLDVGPHGEAAVAHICRELDGLPLALELAAARTNVLSVQQIAAGIEESTYGLAAQGTVPRHRTLRATIDWSYQLLTAEEQAALSQLSVFTGGWSLPAAAATCPVIADEQHALALTTSLVDKSLAVAFRLPAEVRYFLMLTVRRYAFDKLRATGELDTVRAEHARHVADLAERAEPMLHGSEQLSWLQRLDKELNNIRAAIAWASRRPDDVAVRLAGALWRYCYLRGRYSEGRAWLADTLAHEHDASPPVIAKALLGAGALAFLQCEYDEAESRIEEALALYRDVDDEQGIAEALQRLGSIARERGQYDRSRRLHEESMALWQALGAEARVAESLSYLGFVAWLTGEDRAMDLCQQTLTSHRRLGDGEGTAWALINLGAAAAYTDSPDLARALLRECLELCYQIGFSEGIAWSLNELGVLARREGRLELAWEQLTESLTRHLSLGDRWRAASVTEELAATAVDSHPKLAARLLGAAAELRGVDARRPPVEEPTHAATVSAARAALGVVVFEEQWAAGLSRGRAAALAEVRATSVG